MWFYKHVFFLDHMVCLDQSRLWLCGGSLIQYLLTYIVARTQTNAARYWVDVWICLQLSATLPPEHRLSLPARLCVQV
jgi:hypothetical protein